MHYTVPKWNPVMHATKLSLSQFAVVGSCYVSFFFFPKKIRLYISTKYLNTVRITSVAQKCNFQSYLHFHQSSLVSGKKKITLNCMTKCIGCLWGCIKAWRKILCRVAFGVSFLRFGVVVWSEWGVTELHWAWLSLLWIRSPQWTAMACRTTKDRCF